MRPKENDRGLVNKGASIRERLLQQAKAKGTDFNYVLNRYAAERLLYRLGQSPYSSSFVLKGATLFTLWSDTPYRPTRDIDLLGFGEPSADRLRGIFQAIIRLAVSDDGLVFDVEQTAIEAIKEAQEYGGFRVKLYASLSAAKIPLQIDIGFGDVMTPKPALRVLPVMLALPAPSLLVYPWETVIAEKYHAMVNLGWNNTRMKDFYDVWVLSQTKEFESAEIGRAIEATFNRRQTALPNELPDALTRKFGQDEVKVKQWQAFCRRAAVQNPPPWEAIIADLRCFLWSEQKEDSD